MGIDDLGRAATPQKDELPLSQRSLAWWILYMPGKVILWFGYMFPSSIVGSFAGARQRNVPLLQLGYSLVFYAVIAFVVVALKVMYENGQPDDEQSAQIATPISGVAQKVESSPAARMPAGRPFDGAGEYKYDNPGCCNGSLELTPTAEARFNLLINTVTNEEQRVCYIEQEDVELARSGNDSGTIDFNSSDAACRIHIAVRSKMITVSATGDQCSQLCGAGAQFEGNYLK